MEIWRDIKGYEGLYQVSNEGRVKSLERRVPNGRGYTRIVKECIMKQCLDSKGYSQVQLHNDTTKSTKKVHRLVAEAFIDNPDNLPEVNHKDECKTSNVVENLEWCDTKYNINYGTHNERVAKSLTNGVTSKPIIQYDLGGNFIQEYPSMHEAARCLGLKQGGISMCCRGIAKTAYGFVWKYKMDELDQQVIH